MHGSVATNLQSEGIANKSQPIAKETNDGHKNAQKDMSKDPKTVTKAPKMLYSLEYHGVDLTQNPKEKEVPKAKPKLESPEPSEEPEDLQTPRDSPVTGSSGFQSLSDSEYERCTEGDESGTRIDRIQSIHGSYERDGNGRHRIMFTLHRPQLRIPDPTQPFRSKDLITFMASPEPQSFAPLNDGKYIYDLGDAKKETNDENSEDEPFQF